MRYSRMIWNLLYYAKNLGFIFEKQNSNSMFLEWYAKFPPKPYMIIHDISFLHITTFFMLIFVKLYDPWLEFFHAPKIKNHVHATNNCCFYTRSTQKHAIHHHEINTPCPTYMIFLSIFLVKETRRLCKSIVQKMRKMMSTWRLIKRRK